MKRRLLSIMMVIIMIMMLIPVNEVFAAFGETGDPIIEGSAAIDILINAGTSSEVLAGDLNQKLYDAIKDELKKAADAQNKPELENINVRISNSNVDLDTSDLSNWYVYDHYDTGYYANESAWKALGEIGYNANTNLRKYFSHTQAAAGTAGVYANGNTPKTTLEYWLSNKGLFKNYSSDRNATTLGSFNQHIFAQVKDGVPMIDFVGYFNSGYHDFIFYPCTSGEEKIVKFDIDSTQVNPHTLKSAGFLVNADINESGVISGYVLYYVYPGTGNDPVGTPPTTLYLYKIKDGVTAATLHNHAQNATSVSSLNYASLFDEVASVPIGSAKWADQLSITLNITQDSVTVYQMPIGISPTAEDTPVLKKTGLAKTGNGFGPMVGYLPHGCVRATQFTFSNIKMAYIDQSDAIFGVLSKANYIQHADLYFIDLTDDGKNRQLVNDGTSAAAYMQAKKIRYITNNPEDELLGDGPLDDNGLQITDALNIDELAQRIAEYIISQYGEAAPEYDVGLPLTDPVALLSLVRDVGNVSTSYIDIVKRDLIGDLGLEIYGYDAESKPSDGAAIKSYHYKVLNPKGEEIVSTDKDNPNQVLLTITKDKAAWPAGEYTVLLSVTDTEDKISPTVSVKFQVTEDTIPPRVPSVRVEDGKLSFTTSDIGGYGVVGYELVCTPVNGGSFTYDGNTYTTGTISFPVPAFAAVTADSQAGLQMLSDIILPVGEYTMSLVVHDMAGNKTTVTIPVIDYEAEKLISIKQGTIVSPGSVASVTGTVDIPENWMGGDVTYTTGNVMLDNDDNQVHGTNNTAITIVIPARPNAPTAPQGTATYPDRVYQIKNVDNTMEYKLGSSESYIDVPEGVSNILLDDIEYLDYFIRYKAVSGVKFASKTKDVSIVQDLVSPSVPSARIKDGVLSFTASDIDGSGVAGYELVCTPIGSGFTYGVDTYTVADGTISIPASAPAITAGSQAAPEELTGILLPYGEYTMELLVYDLAGNKTTVKMPVINYIAEKLTNVNEGTVVITTGTAAAAAAAAETVDIHEDWMGGDVHYTTSNVVQDNNPTPAANETVITIAIPARPAAPAAPKGTVAYSGIYKLKYVDDTMEYKVSNGSYGGVPEYETEVLLDSSLGLTYAVRYKAVSGMKFAGAVKVVSLETHSVSGTVELWDDSENNHMPYEDVTVELKFGRVCIQEMRTDVNGSFSFDGVEDGIYNLVVKDADGRITTIQVVVDGDNILIGNPIQLHKLKNTILNVADDTPDIVASGLTDLLTPNSNPGLTGVTQGDLDAVDDGGKLEVILYAKGFEEDTAGYDVPVSKLTASASEHERIIGLYLDLTVTKYVWDYAGWQIDPNDYDIADATQLTHLPALITVRIPIDGIPGLSGETDLKVYRYHDGNSEEIHTVTNGYGEYFELVNNTVILHVRRFSEYAIAYQDLTQQGDVTITVNEDGVLKTTGSIMLVNGTGGSNQISVNNNTVMQAVTVGAYRIFVNGIDTGRTVTVRAGVNVSAVLNCYTLTLLTGEGIKSVAGAGVYLEGQRVTIGALETSGYTFDGWTTQSGIVGDLSRKNTEIIMPSGVLELTATATRNPAVNAGNNNGVTIYDVMVAPASDGTVTVTTIHPVKDSIVTIVVVPNKGFVLDTLVITDRDGNELAFTDNRDGTYTYVQPESTVTITTTYKEIEVTDADTDTDTDADDETVDMVESGIDENKPNEPNEPEEGIIIEIDATGVEENEAVVERGGGSNSTDTEVNNDTDSDEGLDKEPKTGDNSLPTIYIALLGVLAFMVNLFLGLKDRRREHMHQHAD